MLRAYFWATTASLAVAWVAAPVSSYAATPSSADRARIAMLVYQSQAARQADLRRGDSATRELRSKAAAAEKLAAATREELAQARASAKQQVRQLEQQLEEQERELTEAAEKYTAELAKRDEEYARERSILISTGQRLLRTPEGRQVLDLYNAGGQANWDAAKKIMDEARRVRRALDARDAATLYLNARNRGDETTGNVIRVFEEVVRDDPQLEDWLKLAVLYDDAGDRSGRLQALNQAERRAFNERQRIQVLFERARAGYGSSPKLELLKAAIDPLRGYLANHPEDDDARRMFAHALIDFGAWISYGPSNTEDALKHIQEGAKEARRLMASDSKSQAWRLLVNADIHVGDIYRFMDDYGRSISYYDAAIATARKHLREEPESLFARETLVRALEAKAIAYFDTKDGRYLRSPAPAVPLLVEALEILKTLTSDDPDSRFWDGDIQFAKEHLPYAQTAIAQGLNNR